MKEINGVVSNVWSKQYGEDILYGIFLEDVDGLFKCGKTTPGVEKGQIVTLKIDEGNNVKGIQRGEVGDAPAPKKKSYGGGGNKASSRNDYWDEKAIRDIDTQKIISFQAAANTALAHTKACFELGFLKASKTNGADAFDAAWRERAKEIYRMYQSIPQYYDKLMTGPVVHEDTDDEDPTGRQQMIDQINEDDHNNTSDDNPWG